MITIIVITPYIVRRTGTCYRYYKFSITLVAMMDAVRCAKILVIVYQNTRCHNTKGNLNFLRRGNLKFEFIINL
jgi:hypothetical protein